MHHRLILLRPLLLALFALIAIEISLETRHHFLGFEKAIFSLFLNQNIVVKNSNPDTKYGPTNSFPFRSRIFPPDTAPEIRIWIASASHAEHSRLPVEIVFPNRICGLMELSAEKCQVVNASRAGRTIENNIDDLNVLGKTYRPEFAVLYQMSLTIDELQNRITSQKEPTSANQTNSLIELSYAHDFFERTSIYQHTSDYIGGNIKLSGILHEHLPRSLNIDFQNGIRDYIEACRDIGAIPVLTTFAASHNHLNISKMPHNIKTNFVRYGNYLSPIGWVNTISDYNNLLRQLAETEKLPIIDIAAHLNGKPEYFVDFVHFNAQGHEIVAGLIADSLATLLSGDEE